MENITTEAGDYKLFLGAEGPPKEDAYQPDKWYFEPADYVGLTIFSDPYDSREEAQAAAIECGEREETLRNEIGGGG